MKLLHLPVMLRVPVNTALEETSQENYQNFHLLLGHIQNILIKTNSMHVSKSCCVMMLLLITTLINKWVSMHHGTRKTNWQTKMVVTTDMQMEAWNFREETPFLPKSCWSISNESFICCKKNDFFTTNCVSTETCQICLKFQSQEAKKGKRRTSKSHRQGQEETELIPNCQIFSSHSYKRNPWEDLSSHAGELVTMSTKPPSASLVSSPWSLSLPLSSSLLALLFLATNNVCVHVCVYPFVLFLLVTASSLTTHHAANQRVIFSTVISSQLNFFLLVSGDGKKIFPKHTPKKGFNAKVQKALFLSLQPTKLLLQISLPAAHLQLPSSNW